MSRKYPEQTCRDCGQASWVWSEKAYHEGKRRIIVQQPGYCRDTKGAALASNGEKLKAMEPYSACPGWQPAE